MDSIAIEEQDLLLSKLSIWAKDQSKEIAII